MSAAVDAVMANPKYRRIRGDLGPIKPTEDQKGSLGRRIENAVFRAKMDAHAVTLTDHSFSWMNDKPKYEALLTERIEARLAEVGLLVRTI